MVFTAQAGLRRCGFQVTRNTHRTFITTINLNHQHRSCESLSAIEKSSACRSLREIPRHSRSDGYVSAREDPHLSSGAASGFSA